MVLCHVPRHCEAIYCSALGDLSHPQIEYVRMSVEITFQIIYYIHQILLRNQRLVQDGRNVSPTIIPGDLGSLTYVNGLTREFC